MFSCGHGEEQYDRRSPVLRKLGGALADAAVVLIHGLFSSARTWDTLEHMLSADEVVGPACDFVRFSYATPVLRFSPLKRSPDINTVADSLRELTARLSASHERIVLVSHSQGGLVVQRFLARMLNEGRGKELKPIRRIAMIACPNSGSELLLLLRKGLPSIVTNRQERELRPISDQVLEAQRRILEGVEHASVISSTACPIPIVAYAAESDNVVRPASARGMFRQAFVLPGDHFSIIAPVSVTDRTVVALKHDLATALREPFPAGDGTASGSRPSSDYLDELRTYETVSISFNSACSTKFVVHGGPLEQIRDVDIIATSENTYFQMSQTFKPSTSGPRLSPSWKSAAGGHGERDGAVRAGG
jgi:pimeloyl-ACP methyl ester carboxylesterase